MRASSSSLVWGAIFACLSSSSCTPGLSQPRRPEGTIRVATYNIQWFSENANPGRIKNLKSVIAQISPDIVGLQEIQSEAALRQVFDGGWELGMLDDPRQFQELAIAVRKPLILVSTEMVFDSASLDGAFPDRRDVLRAVIQTRQGKQVVVYVVHMKSRRGGRKSTDWQRQMACGLLAAYIKGRSDEPNAVVVGDFNDAPDDVSLNMLESGDLNAAGGENEHPPFLTNLCDPLLQKDYATEGLNSLYRGSDMSAIVPGSWKENGRLRGQDYNFPADVRVPQSLFDQVLVSTALAKNRPIAVIFSRKEALSGRKGRTNSENGRIQYVEKGDLASDHLPVYADLFPQ